MIFRKERRRLSAVEAREHYLYLPEDRGKPVDRVRVFMWPFRRPIAEYDATVTD